MTSITITDVADGELRKDVQAILRAFNRPLGVGSTAAHPLSARATDPDGTLIGGCVAETFWNWLVIDVLAVEAAARGDGVGTALVDAVEAEARARGCTRARTEAWAFQGLRFWTKRGYEVVGEMSDFPVGHTLYWLRRDLPLL